MEDKRSVNMGGRVSIICIYAPTYTLWNARYIPTAYARMYIAES